MLHQLLILQSLGKLSLSLIKIRPSLVIEIKVVGRHLREVVWLTQYRRSLVQTVLLQCQGSIQTINIELQVVLHVGLHKEELRGISQIFLGRIQAVEFQIGLSQVGIHHSRHERLSHLQGCLLCLQEALQSLSGFFLTAIHISPTVVEEMGILRIPGRILAFCLAEIEMRQLIVAQVVIHLSQSCQNTVLTLMQIQGICQEIGTAIPRGCIRQFTQLSGSIGDIDADVDGIIVMIQFHQFPVSLDVISAGRFPLAHRLQQHTLQVVGIRLYLEGGFLVGMLAAKAVYRVDKRLAFRIGAFQIAAFCHNQSFPLLYQFRLASAFQISDLQNHRVGLALHHLLMLGYKLIDGFVPGVIHLFL